MEESRILFFPVRRKLTAAAVSYLCGIWLASVCVLPTQFTFILCAFAILSVLICRHYRRSVLFCVLLMMFLAGNCFAGIQLGVRDEPTQPGVSLSGTVAAVESDFRVYLTDVHAEGGTDIQRDVLVTLMLEENEEREAVRIGQHVSGTGRLFAPEEKRNPGGVDRRIQAICDGYELSGYILPGWSVEGEERFSLREWIRQLRLALIERIHAQFGGHASLFAAIMIGEKGDVDSETLSAMRLTGTVHLLTVSGLHLGMIAAALRTVLKRLRLGKKLRFAVQAFVLVFFTCLTGGAPGTIRACITALIREMAGLFGRRYEPLTALSASAMVLTLVCPVMALNASFQFSYFVVLGLLLLMGTASRILQSVCGKHRLLRRALSELSLSLIAQLSAIPMQLLLYGYIPLLALPMNLLCGFCMPLLMLGGWLALAVGALLPNAGGFLSSALGWMMGAFEALSRFFAEVKGGILRLPAPYAATVLLVPVLLALVSDKIRMGKGRYRLALFVCIVLLASYAPRIDGRCAYVQLDVGQGDAALFREGRRAVLIDAGPADSYDMLRYLRHEGLSVEKVILSHLDVDHAGALLTLLESEIRISGVVMPEGALSDDSVTETVQEALALAREKDVEITFVRRGDQIVTSVVAMNVLSPDAASKGSNERSLLLLCEFSGQTFLTTGDLPSESEPEDAPDCSVLKVAHHGSQYATSKTFLAQTTPEIALISVGLGNYYGHPTQRVLDDLESIGAAVYRTDLSGCLTVYPTENGIRVESYLPLP